MQHFRIESKKRAIPRKFWPDIFFLPSRVIHSNRSDPQTGERGSVEGLDNSCSLAGSLCGGVERVGCCSNYCVSCTEQQLQFARLQKGAAMNRQTEFMTGPVPVPGVGRVECRE